MRVGPMTPIVPVAWPCAVYGAPTIASCPPAEVARLVADDDVPALALHRQVEQLHELLARVERRHQAAYVAGVVELGLARGAAPVPR